MTDTDKTTDERAPSPRTLRAVAAHYDRRVYDLRRAMAVTGDTSSPHVDALNRMTIAAETARDEALRLERGDAVIEPRHQFNIGGWPQQQSLWPMSFDGGNTGDGHV